MTSTEEKSSGLIAPLVKTAGIIGVAQGLVWLLFSIASILIYEQVLNLENPTGLGINIPDTLFYVYLYKEYNGNSGAILIPEHFIIFVYCYLVLSLSLLIISSIVLSNTFTGKAAQYYDKIIGSWVLIVAILSLLDLILVCLLAHDYEKYKDISTIDSQVSIVLASVGIVMTLAARGFVLWILNITFAIILGKHCYTIYNKGISGNRPVIDGYSSGPRPWTGPSMYDDSIPSEFVNKGYKEDEDLPYLNQSPRFQVDDKNFKNRQYDNRDRSVNPINPINSREIPHANLKRPANDNYWYNRNQQISGNGSSFENGSVSPHEQPSPYAQPAPVRTAKIGRQGGQRSPPLNVAPPFIPDPDYSPPGSPHQVRGVLRPKSNYINY